jgi:hypothetical protein
MIGTTIRIHSLESRKSYHERNSREKYPKSPMISSLGLSNVVRQDDHLSSIVWSSISIGGCISPYRYIIQTSEDADVMEGESNIITYFPMFETIPETRTCPQCASSFEITNVDIEFYKKVSPVFGSQKYLIPPPTRMAFRNERKLYKRKCSATGADIVSLYHPESKYTIYDPKYWWSDKWSPMDYGRDIDLSKSFFEQYAELAISIPRSALILP